MKVLIARSAGFCYGVKRALDGVMKAADESDKPVYTLGPLIHNPQVVEKLEQAGVKSIAAIDDMPSEGILIMPSHGMTRDVVDRARAMGVEIVDLTCPFVAKVHRLAEELAQAGYQVVVLGDPDHTEVKGIMSRAGDDAIAVKKADELVECRLKSKVGVVAQTTQTAGEYSALLGMLAVRCREIRGFNTICDATTDRQSAARQLAADVDVMIVVGGRNSANTRRLTEICSSVVRTYHVETADELNAAWFDGVTRVGVTAGASTPDWIINEVVSAINQIPNGLTESKSGNER